MAVGKSDIINKFKLFMRDTLTFGKYKGYQLGLVYLLDYSYSTVECIPH